MLKEEVRRYPQSCLAPPCRDLCQYMQEKLPRELRGLVYEHLLETQERRTPVTKVAYIKEFNEFQVYVARGNRMPVADWSPLGDVHHIANLKYMCTNTLSELLEKYHKVATFVFQDTSSSCKPHLTTFLFRSTEVGSVSLVPSKVVRKLEIRMSNHHLTRRGENIGENLSLLHQLENQANVNVHVLRYVNSRTSDNQRFIAVVSPIFTLLKELHSAGHNVSIDFNWKEWKHSSFGSRRLCTKDHRFVLRGNEPKAEALQRLLLTENW
jgi:hypothetical protein